MYSQKYPCARGDPVDQVDQSDPDIKQKQNGEEGLIYKPVKGPGSLTTLLFFFCLFQHLISF